MAIDDGDIEVAFSTITCREKGTDTRTDGLLVNFHRFLGSFLTTPFKLCLLATHLIIAIVILVTSN